MTSLGFLTLYQRTHSAAPLSAVCSDPRSLCDIMVGLDACRRRWRRWGKERGFPTCRRIRSGRPNISTTPPTIPTPVGFLSFVPVPVPSNSKGREFYLYLNFCIILRYLFTCEVIPHGSGRVSQGTSAPGWTSLASGWFAHALPSTRGTTGLLSALCRPSGTSHILLFFLHHWRSGSNCQSLVNYNISYIFCMFSSSSTVLIFARSDEQCHICISCYGSLS